MTSAGLPSEKAQVGLLFVLALSLASFSTNLNNPVPTLIQTDLATTFQISVGTAGQAGIYAGFAGIAVGLVMAFLSVKFNHKTLMLVGLLCFSLGSLGAFLSPDFLLYQSSISLHGVADIMVAAMVATLVGEFVVLEKRPRVLSIINAAHSFGYLASAPIAALLAETAGWRAIPGGFLFPVSSIIFFVALFVLPSSKPVDPNAALLIKKRYKEGFKEIFKNKSAVGLLVGLMLAFISGSIGIYSISFLKLKFQLATALGGPLLMIVAALGVIGALTSGAVVPRFGRKNILISSGFLAGLFTIVGFSMPEMWLAVAFRFLAVLFSAIAGTAGSLLAIELVPKYRATLMSLFGVFGASGAILGVILGGRVLDVTKSFPVMGIVLGAFGIASAVECFFLVTDPVRTKRVKEV